MIRNMLLKIAAAACVVAILVCGALMFARTLHFDVSFASAEQYTSGGATLTEPVKNLCIDWTDGSVTIAYHAKNTVEITETAPKAISPDAALRWRLDGDTLRIRYSKPVLFSLHSFKKALTVTLPEGTELNSVEIDAASADVSAPDLRAGSVTVDLASGDLDLALTGPAELVKLNSASGDLRAALSDVQTLSASTVSGDIRASFASANSVSASTVSGGIQADGTEAGKVRLNSTSGRIEVGLTAFDDVRIDTTSGDVTAALSSTPGYRAGINTVSGAFDYTVALTREGGAYTCGDGSGSLRVGTTSGSIRLLEAGER